MKVYIAASFGQYQAVRRFAEGMAEGIELSHDWMSPAARVLEEGVVEDLELHGRLDAQGVVCADVLVLLLLTGTEFGALMEFGAAAIGGKPCIVVRSSVLGRHYKDDCSFFRVPNVVVVESEADAQALLARWSTGGLPSGAMSFKLLQCRLFGGSLVPEISRERVSVAFSLSHQRGPTVGLVWVDQEPELRLAVCLEPDSTERVYYVVRIDPSRLGGLIRLGRDLVILGEALPWLGSGRVDPRGADVDCDVREAKARVESRPSVMPEDRDLVVGYFIGWTLEVE